MITMSLSASSMRVSTLKFRSSRVMYPALPSSSTDAGMVMTISNTPFCTSPTRAVRSASNRSPGATPTVDAYFGLPSSSVSVSAAASSAPMAPVWSRIATR